MTEEEKARLTRQALVTQALALADAEGLETVTIRRLAEELGVTPMALYWHVKNKDELLVAMSDQLLAEVTPPETSTVDDLPWNQQLRMMMAALLGVMRTHPSATALLNAADNTQSENFTRATEVALDLLTKAGFSLPEAFLVASQLLHDVIALAAGHPSCAPGMTEEQRRLDRLAMQALPIDRYPRLVEYASMEEMDREEYFGFGLDLIMAGVEAMAGSRTAGRR